MATKAKLLDVSDENLQRKFWERLMPEPMSGCWLWIGNISSNGYPTLCGGNGPKKVILAHRFSYVLHKGPIEDELLTLDHLCRIRSCVNPAHLEPVSREINVLRGEGPPAKNAQKTHCPRGHEYTEENTYWFKRGPGSEKKYRRCKTCQWHWNQRRNSK